MIAQLGSGGSQQQDQTQTGSSPQEQIEGFNNDYAYEPGRIMSPTTLTQMLENYPTAVNNPQMKADLSENLRFYHNDNKSILVPNIKTMQFDKEQKEESSNDCDFKNKNKNKSKSGQEFGSDDEESVIIMKDEDGGGYKYKYIHLNEENNNNKGDEMQIDENSGNKGDTERSKEDDNKQDYICDQSNDDNIDCEKRNKIMHHAVGRPFYPPEMLKNLCQLNGLGGKEKQVENVIRNIIMSNTK